MTAQVKSVLRRPAFYRVGNPHRMRLQKPTYYASSIADLSKGLLTPKDFSCGLSFFVNSRTKITPSKTFSPFAAMVLSKEIHPCSRISSSVNRSSSIVGAKAIDTTRPSFKGSIASNTRSSDTPAKTINTFAPEPSLTKATLKKTKRTLNEAFHDNSTHSTPETASTDTNGSVVQDHFQDINNLSNQEAPSITPVTAVSEASNKITTQKAPLGISEPTTDNLFSSNADQETHSHTNVPRRLKTSLTTVDQPNEKISSMLFEQSTSEVTSTFTNAYIGQEPLVTFSLPRHKVSIAETFIDRNTTGNADTEKSLIPVTKFISNTSPKITDQHPQLVCQPSIQSLALSPDGTSSSKRALSMTFDSFIYEVPSKAVCLSSRAVSPMITDPSIPELSSMTISSSSEEVPSLDTNQYSTELRENSQKRDLIGPITNVSRSKANNITNSVPQSSTSVPFHFYGSKRLLQYSKSVPFKVNKHLSYSIPERSFGMGLYFAFRKLRQYLSKKLKRLTESSHLHSLSRRSATREISIPRLILKQGNLVLLRRERFIFPSRYLENRQLRTNTSQKSSFKGHKRKNVTVFFSKTSTPRAFPEDIFDNYDVKRSRLALKPQQKLSRDAAIHSSICCPQNQQSGSQYNKNTITVNSISHEDDMRVFNNEMNTISADILNKSDLYPSDRKNVCKIETELVSKDNNTLPSTGLEQENSKQQNDLADKVGLNTAIMGYQAELFSKDKNARIGADDRVKVSKLFSLWEFKPALVDHVNNCLN